MFPHFMFILYVLSPRGINLNPLYRIWHTFLIATNQEIIFTKKKKKTKTKQTPPPPITWYKFPVSQFACEYLKKKNIPKHCYNLSSPLCIPFIFYTSFASEENRQNHSCKCWHGLCKFSLVSFIWLYTFPVFITYSILFVCFFFLCFSPGCFSTSLFRVCHGELCTLFFIFYFFFLPNSSAQRQILLFISCLLLLSFSHHHSLILSITQFAFSLFAGIILLSYTRRHMLLILLIENAADLILIRL